MNRLNNKPQALQSEKAGQKAKKVIGKRVKESNTGKKWCKAHRKNITKIL